ncbi:transcription regulatory protein SNF2 isoform X2 [Arachis ipaensis]|uniref:transcription regulatory protein SNF2 isoform X2 n=1 Tax=Arachis ipaensis TaxID=130454 RepID=UPI0007AF34AD|nr:transcription regulatory protein SNF2 isoform X2 [Arachis ipaensis]
MDEEEKPDSPPQPLPNNDEHSRRNRIIANLKDSLLSQLAKSNPSLSLETRHVSSLIQQRLKKMFPSFHTPTHPPYALMIHRAISELNDNKGSTEEEISNFIVKEYEDLPWAHKKILGIQLEKLCQDEEIVCNEGGRYVLQADGDGIDGDRKGRQECKSKRKKRGKKRSQHSMDGGGERKRKRVKICEEIEKSDKPKEGRDEAQHQVYDLGDVRTDEPISVVKWMEEKGEEALDQSAERVGEQNKSQGAGVVEQYVEAEPLAQELQDQYSIVHPETICSECVLSEGQLKQQMSSLDVPEQKQDGNSVSGDPEKHSPKRQCRGGHLKSKPVADDQEECFLPLRDLILDAQKPKVNIIENQWQSSPQVQVAGQGKHKEPTMFKNTAMLAPENVHNDQPLHGNQGYENPVSGNVEHRPAKRPRGRPRKSETDANNPREYSRGRGRGDGVGRGRGKGSGRGRGRPRKIKLDTNTNQCEEQLQSQDHAEGLVNLGNPIEDDNQSLQQKQQPDGQQQQEQDQGLVSESKPESEEASKPAFG